MSNRSRKVAVIGLGSLGLAVARELMRLGDQVLGVDSDERRVTLVADELFATAIADASELKAMEELDLGDFDAIIITISQNLEGNILAAMNALTLDAPSVWARAQSETHRSILDRIGVHHIVAPEYSAGLDIAQRVHNPRLRNYIRLGRDVFLAEVRTPDSLAGKPLERERFEQERELQLVGVIRGERLLDRSECEHAVESDDLLLISGKRGAIRQFTDGDGA